MKKTIILILSIFILISCSGTIPDIQVNNPYMMELKVNVIRNDFNFLIESVNISGQIIVNLDYKINNEFFNITRAIVPNESIILMPRSSNNSNPYVYLDIYNLVIY